MIAHWKSLVVVSVVLAAIAWLGRHNDSGTIDHPQQVSAVATGCGTPSSAWSMSAAPIRRRICRSYRTALTSEHPQNVPPSVRPRAVPLRT
jgi:hypothetical protein